MRKNFKRLISLILAVIMLVVAFPLISSAAGTVTVYTDEELRAALQNGGEIIVDGYFGPELDLGPYIVSKDTTIYMIYSMTVMAHYRSDMPDMPVFKVEGATLTLDTIGYGGFDYYGYGSMFELVGNENAKTAVVVRSGNYNTYPFNDMTTGECGSADSIFNIKNSADASVDIAIYGGSFCNRDKQYLSDAPVFSGDNHTAIVKGGIFYTDISDMLEEGYAAINQYNSYQVMPVVSAEGSSIDSLLNDEGKFVIKRFEPQEDELDMMAFALDMLYNEGESEVYLTFYWDSYNFENRTVYASKTNEPWGEPIETYLLELEYVYDLAVKAQIDEIVDKIPQGELNEWEEYEPYYFEVSDLALLNYWQTWYMAYNPDFEEVMPNDNIDNLILYSEEFKQVIGYKNFGITIGAGDGGPFFSEAFGDGEFKYGDIVYASKQMGARANSIFYVPEDTADEDILSTLQQRIDDYLGEGVVTVEENGLVIDKLLFWEYEGMGYEEPFEEWKAGIDLSEYNVAEGAEIPGLENDAMCYSVTINEIEHIFVVLRDESKMTNPEYLNIDLTSNVSVSTNNSTVPLDTIIKVDSLEEQEQKEMLDLIGADEGKTYDITLYSNSKNSYITTLANGEFEVKFPIPEEYKGKSLMVYYVDEQGKTTPHIAREEGDFAVFTTNHFSAYTLTVNNSAKKGDVNGDGNVDVCDLVAVGIAICGTTQAKETYDINGDSTVNWDDVTVIRNIILQ